MGDVVLNTKLQSLKGHTVYSPSSRFSTSADYSVWSVGLPNGESKDKLFIYFAGSSYMNLERPDTVVDTSVQKLYVKPADGGASATYLATEDMRLPDIKPSIKAYVVYSAYKNIPVDYN